MVGWPSEPFAPPALINRPRHPRRVRISHWMRSKYKRTGQAEDAPGAVPVVTKPHTSHSASPLTQVRYRTLTFAARTRTVEGCRAVSLDVPHTPTPPSGWSVRVVDGSPDEVSALPGASGRILASSGFYMATPCSPVIYRLSAMQGCCDVLRSRNALITALKTRHGHSDGRTLSHRGAGRRTGCQRAYSKSENAEEG
jgi:hypothetical protein